MKTTSLSENMKNKQIANAEASCKALIRAYANGEKNGGSIEWSELDHAHELALKAFPKRSK